jgi:outer membrane protein
MPLPVSKWLRIFGLALFVGSLLILPISRPASAAGAKIGFVDLQKAVSGTKEWKRNFNSFKSSFKKEKDVIAAKEEKMKKMLENLNKQSFVLDPDLKKKKEEKFRKEKVAFERYVQDKNAEFATKEKEMTGKLLERMITVIKDMGKEKKYTMVIESKALLYHDSSQNLTKEAIKAYDRKYK